MGEAGFGSGRAVREYDRDGLGSKPQHHYRRAFGSRRRGNAGWIRMDPEFGGVTYLGLTHELSGWAWSEALGWIHLPEHVTDRVRRGSRL